MTHAQNPGREVAMFTIGTCALTCALAWWADSRGSPDAAAIVTPVAMFFPALSAFAVQRLVVRQPIFRGQPFSLRLGARKWLLVAPLGFALLVAASLPVSSLLTPKILVDHAGFTRGVAHLGGVPEAGLSPSNRYMLALAMALLIGPILNIPLFLGEELGWRGFMNPRLQHMFGRSGLLLGGAIWAVWHLPMIALGLNYPQHGLLGLVVWVPICMGMNVLLDEVKRCSNSVLPCALAHGAMNQLAPLLLNVLFVTTRFNDLIDGPAGLAGLLVVAVPAYLVYRRLPTNGASKTIWLLRPTALA